MKLLITSIGIIVILIQCTTTKEQNSPEKKYLIDFGGGTGSSYWMDSSYFDSSIIKSNVFAYNKLIMKHHIQIHHYWDRYHYNANIIDQDTSDVEGYDDISRVAITTNVFQNPNLLYVHYWFLDKESGNVLDASFGEDLALRTPYFKVGEEKNYIKLGSERHIQVLHGHGIVAGWHFSLGNQHYLLYSIAPFSTIPTGVHDVLFKIDNQQVLQRIKLPNTLHYSATILPFNDFNGDGRLDFVHVPVEGSKLPMAKVYSLAEMKDSFELDTAHYVVLEHNPYEDNELPAYIINNKKSNWFFGIKDNFDMSITQQMLTEVE